jgi:hypothetical protein
MMGSMSLDTQRIRPLNLPRIVMVRADTHGIPQAVRGRSGWVQIEGIRESWRLEDLWWRDPLLRNYFEVVLEGGRVVCLFQDEREGCWYLQR